MTAQLSGSTLTFPSDSSTMTSSLPIEHWSGTASGTSSMEFTNIPTSAVIYNINVIEMYGSTPCLFGLQASTGGWVALTGYYYSTCVGTGTNNTYESEGSLNNGTFTYMPLMDTYSGISPTYATSRAARDSSSNVWRWSGHIQVIKGLQGTGNTFYVSWNLGAYNPSGTDYRTAQGAGWMTFTPQLDGLRLITTTGNFAGGLYSISYA